MILKDITNVRHLCYAAEVCRVWQARIIAYAREIIRMRTPTRKDAPILQQLSVLISPMDSWRSVNVSLRQLNLAGDGSAMGSAVGCVCLASTPPTIIVAHEHLVQMFTNDCWIWSWKPPGKMLALQLCGKLLYVAHCSDRSNLTTWRALNQTSGTACDVFCNVRGMVTYATAHRNVLYYTASATSSGGSISTQSSGGSISAQRLPSCELSQQLYSTTDVNGIVFDHLDRLGIVFESGVVWPELNRHDRSCAPIMSATHAPDVGYTLCHYDGSMHVYTADRMTAIQASPALFVRMSDKCVAAVLITNVGLWSLDGKNICTLNRESPQATSGLVALSADSLCVVETGSMLHVWKP